MPTHQNGLKLSHEQRKELVDARLQDFIDDNLTEQLTRASLFALGLTFDEIEEKLNWAAHQWARRAINRAPRADEGQFQRSKVWLEEYLKR